MCMYEGGCVFVCACACADPEGAFQNLSAPPPPPPPPQFFGSENYKKCKENPISVEISQEIRTETHISNFDLKGDLVFKIYVWGDIW